MSYKVVELVYGTDPEKLRPAMKRFVLSVLAAYANHDGSEVRPGLPRLAQRCGLSIDAVYRWRRLLRVEGWIVQVAREDRRRNKPAVYRIDLNKLQAAAWKGLAADSAAAQSQDSKSDSAPAPMKKGSDSALAPKSDSALAPKTPVLLIGLTPNGTTCRRSWGRGRLRRGRAGSGRPPSGFAGD